MKSTVWSVVIIIGAYIVAFGPGLLLGIVLAFIVSPPADKNKFTRALSNYMPVICGAFLASVAASLSFYFYRASDLESVALKASGLFFALFLVPIVIFYLVDYKLSKPKRQ